MEPSYKRYLHARNLVWQLLIDLKILELPVKTASLCRTMGISVFYYSESKDIIHLLKLTDKTVYDGFTVLIDGKPVIFYDDEKPSSRIRFTIAHELGHLLLGHLIARNNNEVLVSGPNREPAPDDDPQEAQANIFASRLLAPACVLWGLGVKNAEQIASICNISKSAATFRMERMRELYRRDKFLKSNLERQVYEQFQPFIKANKL